MLFNLLTDATKTRAVGLDEAALYALLGFLVVFIGIALLIFIVWAVGKIMQNTGKTNAPTKATQSVQPAVQPTPSAKEELDEETVAVITAALMAYYQKNNPQCDFIVRRIKRI